MRLSDIKRNDRSTGGCWWDFQTGQRVESPSANLCLLIAERDNPNHRTALARLQLDNADKLRAGGEAAAAAWKAIQTRAVAEAILLGWANLDADDGTPMPHSADAAERVLSDAAAWPLRHFVDDASSTVKGYRLELEEAAKGN